MPSAKICSSSRLLQWIATPKVFTHLVAQDRGAETKDFEAGKGTKGRSRHFRKRQRLRRDCADSFQVILISFFHAKWSCIVKNVFNRILEPFKPYSSHS